MPTPFLRLHAVGGDGNLELFTNFAFQLMSGFVNLIAVVTNAASEDVRLELISDITPDRSERSFLQFTSEYDEHASLLETRLVNAPAAIAFHEALHSRSDETRDRLIRALQQYVYALRYWTPTTKTMAVVHAFMAAEAMVDVAKRSTGLDDNELAERHIKECKLRWRRRVNDIRNAGGAYARRHVIFHGDVATHNIAKKISDGFEHGYGDYATIRELATAHGAEILGHVRRAIFELAELEDANRQMLLSEPFVLPLVRHKGMRAEGKCVVAEADELFPKLPLELGMSLVNAVSYDAISGAYTFSGNTNIDIKKDGVLVDRILMPLNSSANAHAEIKRRS